MIGYTTQGTLKMLCFWFQNYWTLRNSQQGATKQECNNQIM